MSLSTINYQLYRFIFGLSILFHWYLKFCSTDLYILILGPHYLDEYSFISFENVKWLCSNFVLFQKWFNYIFFEQKYVPVCIYICIDFSLRGFKEKLSILHFRKLLEKGNRIKEILFKIFSVFFKKNLKRFPAYVSEPRSLQTWLSSLNLELLAHVWTSGGPSSLLTGGASALTRGKQTLGRKSN